jgi:hypothetical protein
VDSTLTPQHETTERCKPNALDISASGWWMQNAMKRPVNQYESNPTYLNFFTTTRNGHRAPRKSMRSTYTVAYGAASMNMTIYWDVTPTVFCGLFQDVSSVERYDELWTGKDMEGSRRDISRWAHYPSFAWTDWWKRNISASIDGVPAEACSSRIRVQTNSPWRHVIW